MLSMFSFHSLIPELKVESGHLYPYHKKVEEAVTQGGGDFYAYTNYRATLNLPTSWKKWFRRKRDPHYHLGKIFKLFVDFSRLFLGEGIRGRRIFFYESFSTADLTAFIFSALIFAKKEDRVWLLFRFVRPKRQMRFQGFLMRFARKVLGNKLLILCDSELLAPQLERLFHQKIDLLPHYLSFSGLKFSNKRSDKIVMAWPGGPRLEKGLATIEKLLQLEDGAAGQFLLLLPKKVAISPRSVQVELEVELREENLDWVDYVREFERSQVILLPYDPKYYQMRTSAIFIETLLAKKIPLVRAGTWLAEQVKKFDLTELIVDWEDPHFFTKALQVINSKDVTYKLAQMHEAYQKEHSMDSFKEKIRCLNV